VSHCIICPYKPGSLQVQWSLSIPPSVQSMLLELPIANDPAFSRALKRLEPIVVEQTEHPHFQQQVAVGGYCYQDQPNARLAFISALESVPARCRRQYQIRRLASQQLKLNWYGVGRSSWNGDRPRHPLQRAGTRTPTSRRILPPQSEFLANTSHNSAPLSTVCSVF